MLIKFPSDKINVTKNELSFLSRAPTHHSSCFNSQLLYKMKYKVYLSKTVCLIFHFNFPAHSYQALHFCSTKTMDSLTLKHHNSIQNKDNGKVTHSFASKPLIFKLK